MDDTKSRWVYLVGSTLTRPVKIGVATNVKARLDELRVGSPLPLHLIWKARGGRALERTLHEYFSPYRIHGEWFDFGDENPAALVATAAVLMGSPSHPQRVAAESRLRIVQTSLTADASNVIGHLINAASETGRSSVTNAEAFAYLASVDPEFARSDGEGDEQYRSRVGKRLAAALRAEGIAVRLTKVTTADGTRSNGYRLEALRAALSARFERRQPVRATWPPANPY
ncbi:GIY-YIG nuclease family protein [Streptomyces yunnanensis]|uniref:Meiotically up-regulated gene 113 n=1 Tax=Streptomyces yunnanensis TaxID=156453 RepID=A0A9X8MTC3_9ACTN|nr:GIY-YIG nuclease family protein [Streptomyces yunnanensis]SHL74993.1 Meiotically up-regulated gene 113 [Streptomyces yunnanensis]